MIKVIILALLATFLIAGNPKVYPALGDVIYDNVEAIEKLKDIPAYAQFKRNIDLYVKKVYEIKDIGYAIESGNKTNNKKDYLQKIRTLSKTNDFFHRTVMNSFNSSITSEDNELFTEIINSGLVDTQKYKAEILEYYFVHCAEVNATGVVQQFLDEDETLRKKNEASKKVVVTKKELQEAKIKRIRQKDKEQQELIKKSLEEELLKKKRNIRKEQIKELSKPN